MMGSTYLVTCWVCCALVLYVFLISWQIDSLSLSVCLSPSVPSGCAYRWLWCKDARQSAILKDSVIDCYYFDRPVARPCGIEEGLSSRICTKPIRTFLRYLSPPRIYSVVS